MDYVFHDITTRSGTDMRVMSPEGININGVDIEFACPGLDITYTKGREMLSPEITTIQSAGDGSIYRGKRFPERIITVGFVLRSSDADDYRAKWNTFSKYLNFENAKIIFNDEWDKYIIGTFNGISDIDEGKLHVKGEFEILCTDPFKYNDSITSQAFSMGGNAKKEVTVTYNGTAPIYPKINYDFYSSDDASLGNVGNCGFVSITNEDGYEIYFGDENDTKGATGALVRSDYSSSLISQWTTSTKYGFLETGLSEEIWSVSGSLSEEGIVLPDGTQKTVFNGYGNGSTQYNGPAILIPMGQTPLGEYPKDWFIDTSILLNKYEGEGGVFGLSLLNVRNQPVFSLYIQRVNQSRFRVDLYGFTADSESARPSMLDLYQQFFFDVLTDDASTLLNRLLFKKVDNQFELRIGNHIVTSFIDEPSLDDYFYQGIQAVYMGFYGEGQGEEAPVGICNGINFTYISHDVSTFSTNDTLTVDCSNGDILLNNEERPEYGNIRNAWSKFALKPGNNKFTLRCSPWCLTYQPTVNFEYSEAFF